MGIWICIKLMHFPFWQKAVFSFRSICTFAWKFSCSPSLDIVWCKKYHTSWCIPRWYLKYPELVFCIPNWCTFHCRNLGKFPRTFRDPTLFCNAVRDLGHRIVCIWKLFPPVYLFFGKYLEDKRLARCPPVKSKNITWLGHLSFCF